MLLDDAFDRRSVRWFERLYGAALLVEVATQIASGVWQVHTGALYPWRHLGIVPLAPPALVATEWALVVACATALLIDRGRRAAWRVLAPVLLWGVLQRFSNHGSLFFMIALFVAMSPPDLGESFETSEQPNLGLVRAQIVIVYVVSALAKLLHGFTSGASLTHLFHLTPGVAKAGSWVVIAGELALAVLVVKRPRIAVVAAAAMHGAFALAIPNVLSFGLAMVAMAALWNRALNRERGGPSPSPSDRAASDALPPPPRT